MGDPVAERIIRLGATVFLSVSGGKDSSAAAHYALQRLRSAGFSGEVVMIYAHTPLALPENLEYVKTLAGSLGVKLEVVMAEERYGLDYIRIGGLPSPPRRWCMWRWKIMPMAEARKKYPVPHVSVLGIREHESQRRLNIYGGKDEFYYMSMSGSWYWLPIKSWSKRQRDQYLEEHGIPRNPLWGERGHSSHDCIICIAFAAREHWLYLKRQHPTLFKRILVLYREANENRRKPEKHLAWNHVDLDEIDKETSLDDFTPPKACGCDFLNLGARPGDDL